MNKVIAIVFASSLGLSTIAAGAVPIGPINYDATPTITKVAGGCGPDAHRGPYGHCRPMFSCPRGWHPGPYGRHCFRNR